MRSKTSVVAVVTMLTVAGGCTSSGGSSIPTSSSRASSSGAAASSRGFDGKTIKVAGIGELADFSGAEVGAQARFKRALSTISWQIPGLVGPIDYPASSAVPTPSCGEFLVDAPDGSGYQIVEPYGCVNPPPIPINRKFTG